MSAALALQVARDQSVSSEELQTLMDCARELVELQQQGIAPRPHYQPAPDPGGGRGPVVMPGP